MAIHYCGWLLANAENCDGCRPLDCRRRDLRWLGRTLPRSKRGAWLMRIFSKVIAAVLPRDVVRYRCVHVYILEGRI
jgi:hypothetical protein